MNGNLNKGTWKSMENTWASALKEGKQVSVKIESIYSGKSIRQNSFNVEYSIGNAVASRYLYSRASCYACAACANGIVDKSNGAISPSSIRFKAE